MISPVFKCPYCEKDIKPTIDFTGDMPVGMMPVCDCPESRQAWEAQHRAEVEARKNALRNGRIRASNLLTVGRTTPPKRRR